MCVCGSMVIHMCFYKKKYVSYTIILDANLIANTELRDQSSKQIDHFLHNFYGFFSPAGNYLHHIVTPSIFNFGIFSHVI